MAIEEGQALQSRGFVALLLLVGIAAVIWGLYEFFLADPVSETLSVFNIALGAVVVLATLIFVMPELSATEPIPLRTYLGNVPEVEDPAPVEKVEEPAPVAAPPPPVVVAPLPVVAAKSETPAPVPGLASLREYLDLMNQIDAKWEKHVGAVLAATPVSITREPERAPVKPARPGSPLLEAEVLAFHSAASTGVPRSPNEDAIAYVERSQKGIPSRTPPNDVIATRAASADILEAHRALSAQEFEALTARVKGKLGEIGERVGVVRGATEALNDYAARLYETARRLEIASARPLVPSPSWETKSAFFNRILLPEPRPPLAPPSPESDQDEASEPAPVTAPASASPEKPTVRYGPVPGMITTAAVSEDEPRRSLVWSLALFQGFLKSYFNSDEVAAISREALASAMDPSESSDNELALHARLVRNAILAARRKSRTPEELAGITAELDRFVATLVETGFK